MKKRILGAAIPGILLLTLVGDAAAQSALAVISVGSGSGSPGDTVVVQVSLNSQGGAQVSGVNFTLGFDGGELAVSRIDPGSAALLADKDVGWSPIPTCSGSCTVIVVAINNQNVIPDGTIAEVFFDVLPGASSGTLPLSLTAVAATDPQANGVQSNGIGGSFQVIAPTHTPAPTATNNPSPTSTPTFTLGPSATLSNTPTAEPSPTPSNTSPPTATNTPGPSPTASSTPSGTLTPSATVTSTATRRATATRTPTSEGAGEGLELEGAAAATGTALAAFERAVAATSTALAEEIAARPTDQLVATGPSSGALLQPAVFIAAGLLLFAILLGGGLGYLIWRRRQM